MTNEGLDERQLRQLSTSELVRHALIEAKLLARAEVLHAKQELRDELQAAKVGGILIGAGALLALVGLVLLFVALALALPLAGWLGALVVATVALGVGGLLAYAGSRKLPRKPMARTQERLKADVGLTLEQFA